MTSAGRFSPRGPFVRLMRHVPEASLRRECRRRLWRVVKRRREPLVLQAYAIKCAMHYHVRRMVREMLVERAADHEFVLDQT
jgi:hypothetical protein